MYVTRKKNRSKSKSDQLADLQKENVKQWIFDEAISSETAFTMVK